MTKEYLIEFHWIGSYVKVSALDPVTNTEVSIVGDARATENELKNTAIKKLKYVINKSQPK